MQGLPREKTGKFCWPRGHQPKKGQTLSVRKYSPDSHLRLSYPGRVLCSDGSRLALRTRWTETADYGRFRMQAGEPATEYFFEQRWYAVIRLMDADLNIKGWYCDICTPPQLDWSPEARWVVWYTDLALDVYVDDGGQASVLDRTEFRMDVLPQLDEQYAAACRHAIHQLLGMARWNCGPLKPIDSDR